MNVRLYEYRISDITRTMLLNSSLTVKSDVSEVIKEVISIETNGNSEKAFEVKREEFKDISPEDYMKLFNRYGYYIERQTQRTKVLGPVEVIKIVFPSTRHTYHIKEVLFSNYKITVENKEE